MGDAPYQPSESASPAGFAYPCGMSVADDYEDLRRLVASPQRARHSASTPLPENFLALAGSLRGPGDVAERHDDYIRQRLRERFGDDITTALGTGVP
jgi:hypothetical protein